MQWRSVTLPAVLGLLLWATQALAGTATATFAGGCFWCMQPPFEQLPGVVKTTVGYTGGTVKSPTYEQVSSGVTGHAESIEVVYDPAVVSYEKLLEVFWHNVDPLTRDAQFCDHGRQYRTSIFTHDDEQKRLAENLGDSEVMILRNHGLLSVGQTIGQAFSNIYRLEKACQTQLLAMACNAEMSLPPQEVIARSNAQLAVSPTPDAQGRRRPQGSMEWPALKRMLDRRDASYKN